MSLRKNIKSKNKKVEYPNTIVRKIFNIKLNEEHGIVVDEFILDGETIALLVLKIVDIDVDTVSEITGAESREMSVISWRWITH